MIDLLDMENDKTVIIGHDELVRYLDTLCEQRSFAHAYCFVGPEHVGKSRLAEYFINRIIGEGPAIVLDRKEAQTYTDFTYIEPLEGKKEIAVAQIRALNASLQLTSFHNNYKIVVIDQAQLLNQASSNALLKLLEEPHPRTVMILLATHEERILPTVRSRCVMLRAQPVAQEVLRTYARAHAGSYTRDELESVVRLADGLPGMLVRYLRNREEFDTIQAAALRAIDALSGSMPHRFAFAQAAADDVLLVQALEMVLHDCALAQQRHPERMRLFHLSDRIVDASQRMTSERLTWALEQLIAFREAQSYNVNQQLFLENIVAHV